MAISAAFGELTEVLKCLEMSDAEVKNVEIGEQLVEQQDEITMNLTVGVPVLAGVKLRDGVSIQAENFDLVDQYVEIDLSVTLSVAEARNRHGSSLAGVGTSSEVTDSNAVPAYKDPDALRAVYDEYDTFPEMTEALGADVTSETVRRYMVEYDIHDPNDSRPQLHKRVATEQTQSEPSSEDFAAKSESDDSTSAISQTDENDDSNEFGAEAAADDASEKATGERSGNSATESDEESAPENDSEDSEQSEFDDTSVAELIADTDDVDGDDSLVADGLGIPKGLTVSELTTIVNESKTLYEVKTRLGVEQAQARRLLKETALIDLVTHRLGADQIQASPKEVHRRITLGNSDIPQ